MSKKKSDSKTEVVDAAIHAYVNKKVAERKLELKAKYEKELADSTDEILQFVTLRIDKITLAVCISDVGRVIPFDSITDIPTNSSRQIKGMITFKGHNFLAIDLSEKFFDKSLSEVQFCLLTNIAGQKSSILLNEIPETGKIPFASIQSDVNHLEDLSDQINHIKGSFAWKDSHVLYFDLVGFLEDQKAIVIPEELMENG